MNNLGFTLLELLLTITLISIVIGFVVPNFSQLVKNTRLSNLINEIANHLYLARSEAIMRSTRVTLCKTTDQKSCSSDGNWDKGWIIFSDSNNNAQYDKNAEEEIIGVHAAIKHQVALNGNTNIKDYISYLPTGFTRKVNGSFQNGTLTLCDDRIGKYGKKLILNNAGRFRIQTRVDCP